MLRIARTRDLDAVRALDRVIFVEASGDYPVEPDCGAWWLALDGGEPVGFAGARRLTREPDFAVLERAGVLESHRGLGLHRRLIRARLRWARASGLAGVLTYTTPDNAPSANALIRAGFRLDAPPWRWAGPQFAYWRAEL
ncbi:MAG: GNAT family N-acetyltransferase [Sandaracinaceae bacterium]